MGTLFFFKMPRSRAVSKSPARASSTRGARSTSRARSDAKRKPELKTGHGAADSKAKKGDVKATVAVKVATKKRDGENAPVGGGFNIHAIAAGAWSLMAYTLWSTHKDALLKADGMLATADVMTYAVIAPAYFLVSLVAIHQNNKDLESWRKSIFNSLLFPLATAMMFRTFLGGFPQVAEAIKGVDFPVWVNAAAPTTLNVAGVGTGYKLIAGREQVLFISLIMETFLVDFGKTNVVDSFLGAFKGMVVFILFAVFASANGDVSAAVSAVVPYVKGQWNIALVEYMLLAILGLGIRIFYNTQVVGRLGQGTGDAEVVQANLVRAGTVGKGAEAALKEKNYQNILIDSKNAHSKKAAAAKKK